MRRMSVTAKGRTVEFVSPHTDEEALKRAAEIKSDFAQELVRKHRSSGKLSPLQMAWVHKLVFDSDNPVAKESIDTSGDFSVLLRMFDKAAKRTEHAKLKFVLEKTGKVVLHRAGEKSKHEGSVNITDGRGFNKAVWFGRISEKEGLYASRECTAELVEFLRVFVEEPLVAAKEYGLRHGYCCFTGNELKDEVSRRMGFDPAGAEQFGFDMGDEVKKARTTELDEALKAVGPDAGFETSMDDDGSTPPWE